LAFSSDPIGGHYNHLQEKIDNLFEDTRDYSVLDRSNMVQSESEIVGKCPEDTALLFGGFSFDLCVKNWAANLCSKVTNPEFNEDEWIMGNRFWQEQERFKSGTVYKNLTDKAE
jgi:hypothetical protein